MAWGDNINDIFGLEQELLSFLGDSLGQGLDELINLCVAGTEWLGAKGGEEGFTGITDVVEED